MNMRRLVPLIAEEEEPHPPYQEAIVAPHSTSATARPTPRLLARHDNRFAVSLAIRISMSVLHQEASLIAKQLNDKTVNNVLAVLSKPLRYAVGAEVIPKAPKVGLLRVE